MPVEKRTYGQGAQGEPGSVKTKISAFRKLRYVFDNLVSDTKSFVAFATLGTVVVAIIVAGISYLNGEDEGQDPRWLAAPTFGDRVWLTFGQIVLGMGKANGTGLDRTLAIVLWVGSTAFGAFITAFVTAKLIDLSKKLKKGRTDVVESNHTLILGWSNRIFPLLKEINIANEGGKGIVVVFSNKDREAMDDEIEGRAGDLRNLKIVTRTGDTNNPEDLKRINIAGAKSIVLLDAEGGDANIVATVLAVKAAGGATTKIIAEVDDVRIGESLKAATDNQVVPVSSDQIIARVTAQASRQPGLGAVILDLLDFEGDEVYFTNVPALVGKTYAEALLGFNKSSVIGLVDAKGKVQLNPAGSTKIATGSKLVVIAEDDRAVTYTGVRDDLLKRKAVKTTNSPAKPANLLIIGWSFMGRAVLNELASFLPKGSTVQLVAHEDFVDAAELKSLKFGNLKISHTVVKGDADELKQVTKKKFDEIIVIGYRKGISIAEADAHTMLTMLQLNQFVQNNSKGEPTRLIAEILDSRKAGLARVAAEGDLVISDNLGALLIAQLSENPGLAPVFDDLFGVGGSSLLINPIQNYAPIGKATTFADLVAAASDRGESAIGYRTAANSEDSGSTGVYLNPTKTDSFIPAAGDSLVVVGKF